MLTFDLRSGSGALVARGLYFAGRGRWLRRFCELVIDPTSMGGAWLERLAPLFEAAGDLVGGEGRLFVHYEHPTLEETPRLLALATPPAATPIGWLLWRGGCLWYKDWYFAEGWTEGGRKLQGTLPRDRAAAARQEDRLARELRAFLDALQASTAPDTDAGDAVLAAARLRAAAVVAAFGAASGSHRV